PRARSFPYTTLFRSQRGGDMLAQRPAELSFIPEPAAEQTSNRVEIVGYIGRDPQIRYTADGLMVASVSLATHHWHDEDGSAVQTDRKSTRLNSSHDQ